ncbi:pirin family protein [Ekhidna sp.]|uniref:pirin family protein n=1 Tax=Ekhidna sp. TaxID=2608089 RepID=UPI0032994D24
MSQSPVKEVYPLGFPWKTQDPFLFCVYHRDLFPKGNDNLGPDPEQLKGRMIGQDFTIKDGWRMYHGQRVPGFPQHPHRGFETITVVPEGLVDHSDSMGATGRFGNGDVQWMTAGKGVLHSEMFPLVNPEKDNPLLLFQIWLNLPARSKFVEPHYKMLWSEDIPIHKTDDAEVTIVAGDFNETKSLDTTPDSWASDPENGVAVWLIKIKEGGKLTLPTASNGVNRSVFFYEGDAVSVGDLTLDVQQGVDIHADQSVTLGGGEKEAHLLLLQGKPIGEPVVQQGPFVMNTQEEIYDTIREYQRTQFGGWPWPQDEFVHPSDKGRFALHADGNEEIKG